MCDNYVCDDCPFDQESYREACAHTESTFHGVKLVAR